MTDQVKEERYRVLDHLKQAADIAEDEYTKARIQNHLETTQTILELRAKHMPTFFKDRKDSIPASPTSF